MKDIIKILDESVSNIIAAGEVVENPASMIKELIENSLDAGATSIKIGVSSSGRNVKISDNGKGMSQGDLFLCIERHATSKISDKEDIFNLKTYGFRGEALASIAAVSKLQISSKQDEDKTGHRIFVNGGRVTNAVEEAKTRGTEIEVKELFFNTPARLKFLRTKNTEYTKIRHVILTEALANYNVAFSLVLDGKESLRTSGKGIQNTIIELFSMKTLKNVNEFTLGFLGNMNILKSNRDSIYTFINGRYVKSKIVEKAVIDAYYTMLMKGKYPFAIIFLEIDPKEIDINVHPSKKIIKFSNDTKVYSLVKDAAEKALYRTEEEFRPTVDIYDKLKQDNIYEETEIRDSNFDAKQEQSKDSHLGSRDDILVKSNENKFETLSFKNEVLKGEKQSFPEIKQNSYSKNLELTEDRTVYEKPPENKENLEKQVVKEEKVEYKISKEKNLTSYKDFKILGQLNNMYIIVEGKDSMELYDQHIVHERILYEELKEKHYNTELASQNLLVPVKIEVESADKQIVLEKLNVFQEFGFEIEEFGDNELLIRAVPVFDFRESIQDTFFYMLEQLKEYSKKDIRENIIISMSCKNSIKAGEKLEEEEIRILLTKLHEIGKYTCPHGRPIIVRLPFIELDKKFGRK